ncbi:hypothetical protein E6C27_scaffold236G004630 [Cucumis melo var. makuwa]|uniref:Uncharacterized protein n=1 Tax=Cucumis melo var. makuwa TaxID=1194695 RepID=A0A5A7TRA4_CUCMM|nr:hypothetical protein E6C27_scaffold236G004630 [Cucumis melo var. makuwa]
MRIHFFFPSSFPSPHKPLDNFPNFHSRCRVLRIATIDEHISHPLRDSGVPPRYGKTVKSYCELWTWKLASPASHVDIRMGGREAQRHVAHHLPTLQSLSRHVGYISATSAGTAPGQPSGWRESAPFHQFSLLFQVFLLDPVEGPNRTLTSYNRQLDVWERYTKLVQKGERFNVVVNGTTSSGAGGGVESVVNIRIGPCDPFETITP